MVDKHPFNMETTGSLNMDVKIEEPTCRTQDLHARLVLGIYQVLGPGASSANHEIGVGSYIEVRIIGPEYFNCLHTLSTIVEIFDDQAPDLLSIRSFSRDLSTDTLVWTHFVFQFRELAVFHNNIGLRLGMSKSNQCKYYSKLHWSTVGCIKYAL